jgi:hypothetical protein
MKHGTDQQYVNGINILKVAMTCGKDACPSPIHVTSWWKTQQNQYLEHWNWWLTEWEMVEDLWIFVGLCFTILTKNLDVQHVCKIHLVTSYGWRKRELIDHKQRPFETRWSEQEFYKVSC